MAVNEAKLTNELRKITKRKPTKNIEPGLVYVVLIIGVLISMFTAINVTRTILRIVAKRKNTVKICPSVFSL